MTTAHRKPRNSISSDFTPDEYLDLKKQMKRDYEIARMLDVTENTLLVWKRINKLTGNRIPMSEYIQRAIVDFEPSDYIQLKEQGMADHEIRDNVLFVSSTTLYEWKKENGLVCRFNYQPKRKVTESMRKGIIKASEQGMSQRRVGKMFGIGHTTVYNILKKENQANV